mmetsp:Transcript_18312/g.28520  ORF Transcript_18312/g.28520 Transcript_18312/m.28520 type:complete len:175 (+) Transcript_18312:143-667(+)
MTTTASDSRDEPSLFDRWEPREKRQQQQETILQERGCRPANLAWRSNEAEINLALLKDLLRIVSPICNLFKSHWIKSVPPDTKLFRFLAAYESSLRFRNLSDGDVYDILRCQVHEAGYSSFMLDRWSCHAAGRALQYRRILIAVRVLAPAVLTSVLGLKCSTWFQVPPPTEEYS